MRDIFNSLKAKVDILKAFDKEIADKREKIKNTDSVDPKKLLKEYQDDLANLEDIKDANAEYYSSLSDEDVVDAITGDLVDVYNDASAQGTTIGEIPTKE